MSTFSKVLGTLGAASALALGAASLALAQAPQSGPAAVGSTLEVHINNDGSVLARGAKITSIGSTTINATQTWGSYSLPWVINILPTTNLVPKVGNDVQLADMKVGDYISFSGALDQSQGTGTVNAKVVKDFSLQNVKRLLEKRVFEGTIGTTTGSTTPSTFTYTAGNKSYTVQVAANTTLLSNSWNPISFSQLKSNDKVRVYGALEVADLSKLDAYVVRDTSIK
jgi:hypothetical protein